MGIGHSPRECSPLYRGEVPTHTGEMLKELEKKHASVTRGAVEHFQLSMLLPLNNLVKYLVLCFKCLNILVIL